MIDSYTQLLILGRARAVQGLIESWLDWIWIRKDLLLELITIQYLEHLQEFFQNLLSKISFGESFK